MEQLFRPAADTYDERLLHWLVRGGGATEAMCSAAREAVRRGRCVELGLLEAGLGAREIVRGVLDVSGHYALSLSAWWVEQGLARLIPFETARKSRILPLATRPGHVLCLTAPSGPDPSAHSELGHQVEVVVLGVAPDFEADLSAVYTELDRFDPKQHPFFEYLLQTGVVDKSQRAALEHGHHSLGATVQAALRLGVSEGRIFAAGAAFVNRRFLTSARLLDLAGTGAKPLVPRRYLADVGVSVLHRHAQHLTCVAVQSPDLTELVRLMANAGCTSISTCVTTPSCFGALLDHLYGAHDVVATNAMLETPTAIETLETSSSLTDHPDIPNRFNALLLDAVQSRVSDIHVEAYAGRVDVKFRIDGELARQDVPWLTSKNVGALITKVKVDSRLNIAERRRPQDGVIRRRIGESNIDFRVAIQPTLWGENVVLRILDQRRASAPLLEDLGFSPELLRRFRRLAQNPQGLILLTGPTGCGKTTTLYSLLEELKRGDIKIMTAEDPIEYAIDGVQQSQVNEDIGNTFEHYLRAFLRQDPDVILVGEIRDAQTAEMAIRASLTGHLVLSTLHVNDASGVARRLLDLGVSSNLISQTLLCVLSQRLARRICRECARVDAPSAPLLAELFPHGAPVGAKFVSGRGCSSCRGTGYQGRLALLEFWEIDDGARQLIERAATHAELLEQALTSGMRPLALDGLDKALAGLTSLKELRSVLPYEQIRRLARQTERASSPPSAAARNSPPSLRTL